MSKVDWSKAPEWATCVVNLSRYGVGVYDYHWSAKPEENARLMRCETGTEFEMSNADHWEIVEHRPVVATPVQTMKRNITHAFENFDDAPEWADRVLVDKTQNTFVWSDGAMYAPILRNPPQIIHDENQFEIVAERPAQVNDDRLTNDLRWSASIIGTETISAPSNCRCTFTPAKQPSTAPDLLQQAAQLLAERGQQYDKSGNERSAAKIVAAFNTITGRDLTPGEGWLFLTLLKAVRFYSNTEIPHRDSLEDMIAYAALHAEEYLNDK